MVASVVVLDTSVKLKASAVMGAPLASVVYIGASQLERSVEVCTGATDASYTMLLERLNCSTAHACGAF